MLIHNAVITGSLTYNGVDISDITGSEASISALNSFSASMLNYTASNNLASASFSTRVVNLESTASVLTTASASFAIVSQSYASASGSLSTRVTNTETTASSLVTASGSFSTRVTNLELTGSSLVAASASFSTRVVSLESTASVLTTASASFAVVSSSYASASGSLSTRVTTIEGSYATTGSNVFVGNQGITSLSNAISFTSTGSLYTDGGLRITKDMYVSGTAFFNNVTIYGTQSVNYITSSQLNIGTNIITVNTDTPTVRYGGIAVYDSGSTGLTGSLLWDSEQNHWIYTNPSGSTYSGGMMISGPRASARGCEVGTTSCALMMGQGGDHITSSAILHYSNATCFYGTSIITSTGVGCFSGAVCASSVASAGTITGTSGAFSSTLSSNSDFTVNTNRFIVNAATGNTSVAGTLNVTGQACASSVLSSGTICSTGNTCFGGMSIINSCLGIGTASPAQQLHLTGNLLLQNAQAIRFLNSASAQRIVMTLDANDDLQLGGGIDDIILTTNSVERVRITSGGIACFACQVCSGVGFYASSLQSGITIDSTTNGDTIIAARGLSTALHGIVRTVGQNGTTCMQIISTRDSVDGNLPASVNALWGLTNHAMVIATCNTERMRITNTGIACFACQVCVNDKVVILDPTDGSATALFVGTRDGSMTVGQQVRLDFSQNTSPLARIAGEYTGGTFSSALTFSTNATCAETLTEQLRINCNGIACFRNTVCAASLVSAGNITGTNAYTTGTSNFATGGGNVGIGTSNPRTITNGLSLTIGDCATQTQPYLAFARNSTGGYWAGINWYDNSTRKSFIEENSDFDLRIGTSNCLRATITSTGITTFACQVCAPTFLGSTATLATTGTACTVSGVLTLATLQTGAASVCAGAAIVFEGNLGGTVARIYSRGNMNFNNGSDLVFQTQVSAGGTPQCTMVINGATQRVGIGHFNPSYKLHVDGTVGATAIEMGGTATSPSTAFIGYGMFGYSGVGLGIAAGATGANQGMGFFTCGDFERMRILTNGNVGIGTVCPSAQLHIVAPYVQGTNAISAMWSGVGGFTATLTCASGVQPYATYTFSNGNIVISTDNPTIRFQTLTTTTADMMQIVGASFNANAPYNCNRISALNSSHLSFETGGVSRLLIDNAGIACFSNVVYSPRFFTCSGNAVNTTINTPTTLISIPTGTFNNGIYLFSAYLSGTGAPSTDYSTALITSDANAYNLTNIKAGSNMVISLSACSIQGTQCIFTGANISWTFTRLL